MKLTNLNPRMSPPGGAYQEVDFLCPKCQKHQIMIAIWGGAAGDHEVKMNGMPAGQELKGMKRLWHAEQGPERGWDTLTITPSIDRTGMDACGGWHGFVTNGEAT